MIATHVYRGVISKGSAPCSRPADIKLVDFLIACVARKDQRAVLRDVDLRVPVIHRTMRVLQAGDGLYLIVGESNAKGLWFRASGRDAEDKNLLSVTARGWTRVRQRSICESNRFPRAAKEPRQYGSSQISDREAVPD